MGEIEEAKEVLTQAPEAPVEHADVAAVRAALALHEEGAQAAGQLKPLEDAVAANPNDHQARLAYDTALMGANRQQAAIDTLPEIGRATGRERVWQYV